MLGVFVTLPFSAVSSLLIRDVLAIVRSVCCGSSFTCSASGIIRSRSVRVIAPRADSLVSASRLGFAARFP